MVTKTAKCRLGWLHRQLSVDLVGYTGSKSVDLVGYTGSKSVDLVGYTDSKVWT